MFAIEPECLKPVKTICQPDVDEAHKHFGFEAFHRTFIFSMALIHIVRTYHDSFIIV